jgi:hypothetical protein
MRCPDCNKFVPFDEPEIENNEDYEVEQEDVGSSVVVRFTARMALPCGECSTELKEYTFDCEAVANPPDDLATRDKDDDEAKAFRECQSTPDEDVDDPEHDDAHEWDVTDSDLEATEESKTKDRHGKSIRNPRYMATLRGIAGTLSLRCLKCSAEVMADMSDGNAVEASAFDECC